MKAYLKTKGLHSTGVGRVIAITVLAAGAGLTVSCASAQSLNYSFSQLKIGGGGYVTGIVSHPVTPNLTYARTDTGGVYRWDENTQAWTQLIRRGSVQSPRTNLVDDYQVNSIAISRSNDQTLYVAVGAGADGRVLMSNNRGASWTDSGQRWVIDGNEPNRFGGERLQVDPNHDNIVYFGTPQAGLWRSTNSGASWSQVSGIPAGTGVGVKFVLFDRESGTQNGTTAVIYVGVGGNGVYRSTDGGSSFQLFRAASSNPTDARIAADRSLWVTFDADEAGGSLQRYVPSTDSWQNVTPGNGRSWAFDVDPFDPQRAIASLEGFNVGSGIYRTTNGGTSWDRVSLSLEAPGIPWPLVTDETEYFGTASLRFDGTVPNRMWVPQGLGAWRSNDVGASTITYTNISNGIDTPYGNDVIAPNGVAITAIYDREGFYHANPQVAPSRPHINTYDLDGTELFGGTSLSFSPSDPNFIALAEVRNNGGGEIRGGYSRDGGQTFTKFGTYPAEGAGGNIAVSATDSSNIVWLPSAVNFGDGHVPYYTSNTGNNWRKSNGVSSNRTHIFFFWGQKKALDADKVTGGQFYLLTDDNDGTFYVSRDGGANWSVANYSPTCKITDDCHFQGQLKAAPGKAGHVWSASTRGGLYYTTDAGQTPWVQVPNVQNAVTLGFGKAAPGSNYPTIFITGTVNNQYGIYRSTDQAASWQLISDAPNGVYEVASAISGDMTRFGRVYVGFRGAGFAYGDDTGSPPVGGTDDIGSVSYPSNVGTTGPISVTVNYSTTQSRTIIGYLWDENYSFKGSTSTTVDGSGQVILNIPDYSSITTNNARVRIQLGDNSNVLDTDETLIPVGTPSVDDLTSISYPSSVGSTGTVPVTVNYSAVGSRTITGYLWDEYYNWRGEVSITVNGSGQAVLNIPNYSSITTGNARVRVQLSNGTNILDTDETAIPVQ